MNFSSLMASASAALLAAGFRVEQKVTVGYTWGFEPSLFNNPDYVQAKYGQEVSSFYLCNTAKSLTGLLHFIKTENAFISLPQAPYGGLEFMQGVAEDVIQNFCFVVLNRLRNEPITQIEIRQAAEGITNEVKLTTAIWQQQGFQIFRSEINHHLPVTRRPISEILHLSARRRLNKALNAGLFFQIEEATALPAVFDFINTCRQQKGYTFSMDLGELKSLFKNFPERYFIFTVRDGGEICAASLAMKPVNEVLYNFAPAHAAAYNQFSPVILLTSGIYDWCQHNSINLLDLGTSMLGENQNKPLITFKEHLGGVASVKQTLVLNNR